MSNSVRPQRWQPTNLFCPWDSPGKNTGVGCHFLLQCMRVKSESEVAQSCPTSRSHGLQPTRLFRPWDFPSKNTGVGCHCLLPDQGSILCPLHCKCLSHWTTREDLLGSSRETSLAALLSPPLLSQSRACVFSVPLSPNVSLCLRPQAQSMIPMNEPYADGK